MSVTDKILSILMALMLTTGNMVFSSHVASHAVTDSGICTQCMNAGTPDTAITPEAGQFLVSQNISGASPASIPTSFPQQTSHNHRSRAPPSRN